MASVFKLYKKVTKKSIFRTSEFTNQILLKRKQIMLY